MGVDGGEGGAAAADGADAGAAQPVPTTPDADERPVAVVVVDTPLAHLDRPFEYAVPPALAEQAVPGARVRVRFAGRDLDGFVLARRAAPEHDGRLSPLRTVVSPEPVLAPQVLRLAEAVAARYAGTLPDVLRLAVPRRHAGAEKALDARAVPTVPPVAHSTGLDAPGPEVPGPDVPGPGSPGPDSPEPEPPTPEPSSPHTEDADASVWSDYPAGPALLRRIREGEHPAAAWLTLPGAAPGRDWPEAFAEAAEAALTGGRGVLLVVPDHRDVRRVDAALTDRLGSGRHVRLTSDQGAQARYTAFLKVLRGHVRCVVGTRAAMWAPVRDLGLVAWWDDGDDLLTEPRAPYPHVREVLRLRAEQSQAALVVGGYSRSVEIQSWVEQGALAEVAATSATTRTRAPAVRVAGEGTDAERDGPAAAAHLPSAAWRVAHAALTGPRPGPVLVQVPRRGYLPSLSCAHCRTPARCSRCHGPLALPGPDAAPTCRWCGTAVVVGGFVCRECGGTRLRSSVVGARRTAEELGRAFPGALVRTSGAGEVLETVAGEPALVIATPGAEPVAEGGYAAVLLLDAWALLDRPEIDAHLEALRRWCAAAALAKPAAPVVLAGAPHGGPVPAVEALVRWAPVWLAARELAERRELDLPPAVALAALTGERSAVTASLAQARLPEDVERIGPLPVAGSPEVQVLLRAPLATAAELAGSLHALRSTRSARKDPQVVTVRVDPVAALR